MAWHVSVLLLAFAGLLALSQGQENLPPEWNEVEVATFLRGVREDTPVGSVLGKLSCTDQEGDPIYYDLTSGTVVDVSSDGTVRLDVPLDFEKKDNIAYDLTFTCVDMDQTGRFRHAPVELRAVISPDDANDLAPQFSVNSPDGYSFFLSEDAPVDTVLTPQISITDEDRGDNAKLDLLYLICNSPFPDELVNIPESSKATCEKFSVDFTQIEEGDYVANLTLIDSLDFESRRVYSSKLVAIDGGAKATAKLTTTVNILINVQDAQDTGPVFINPSSASVSESARIGSIVTDFQILARDGDLGSLRPVKLKIIEAFTMFDRADTLDAFELTEAVKVTIDTGEAGVYGSRLVVKNQLDREAIATAYEFTVKVIELDSNTLNETGATATATYSVFVTDSNDNPPIFSQSIYYVNVTEMSSNQPTQISGFRIDCTDPDEPSNARYRVRVVEQSFPTYSVTPGLEFTGSASMFLQVANSAYLDYDNELYREQKVVLEAREVSTAEVLSSSTTIYISLRDINDNSPIFGAPSYTVAISESLDQFPYNLLNISATDKDSVENGNGKIEYRLEGEISDLFTIDSETGRIFLLKEVNYEETSQYVFLAYAQDLAESPRQQQVQVTVDILNFNDEGPRFTLPIYQTSVNEPSLEFFNKINIKAVDNEDDTVAITYRIVSGQSPNNAFVINSITGELTLSDYLKYEDTIPEANGEPSGEFRLIVEASDNGSPPQTNTVPVLITVIDVNDHSPVLDPRRYSARLSELAPPGQFIVKINATDDDSGVFGTITFRIGQGLSDNFFVNPATGVITVGTNRVFDYDVQSSYELEVIASDGGAPQKSATATVFIEITDGNNQSPEFSELLYYIYVEEKQPVNTVVQTIKAADKDSTANLVYSILPNNIVAVDPDGKTLSANSQYDYKNAFDVNNEGEIYIKNRLSREAASQISFGLRVKDTNTEEGVSTATTRVTILITGEANTNITFDLATTVYMNENADVGYSAITVTARDPNNNAVQNYEMIDVPGSSDNFEVKANGRIVLVKRVDYEEDPQLDHLHRIVVRAVSNDRKQSATTTATVSIVDVNDNEPQFQRRFYEAQVPETYTYPMEVLTIYATDEDSRSYGPLEFSISGGLDADDFQIFQEAPSTGSKVSRRAAVIVSKGTKLDYNSRSQYSLDITVVDNANQAFSSAQLNANARLIIRVVDENNNFPEFVESQRSLAVPETAAQEQSIATLVAIDRDFGENGEIVYSLEPIADDQDSRIGLDLFKIGSTSGTVRVRSSLLGRGGEVYQMRVRARDQGDRPNSGFMSLTISVQSTEDDDGNPKWISPVNGLIVTAPEEKPNHVLTYNGQTRFFEVNPRTGTGIQYALSTVGQYANSFRIDRLTGEITIVDSLDREQQQDYTLMVYAEDTSNPSQIRSGRQLVVRLIDIDDNSPTFTNPNNYVKCETVERTPTVQVKENTPNNTVVYTLKACDSDTGQFSQTQFELYNDAFNGFNYCREGNEQSIFHLDGETGNLVTTEAVDFEQRREYFMCIKALPVNPVSAGKRRKKREFDLTKVDNSLDNVAYIYISIVDENDNGPHFPQDQEVAVVRTMPDSGPVITLRAYDPDGGANNVVVYRVTSSVFIPQGGDASQQQVAPDLFTLRGASGALYPALPSYQSFSGGRFVLTVRAIDRENSSFTDDVTVTIYVHEEGQAMKLILSATAREAILYAYKMIQELDEVSDRYSFTYLQLSEHRTDDGVDPDKADACFLAIDEETDIILNIRQVISVLDRDDYREILSKAEYKHVDRGLCYPQQSSEEDVRWRNLWWVLVGVAIFVFVCCIILIVLVVMLYDKYRRYMETRQTYLVSE